MESNFFKILFRKENRPLVVVLLVVVVIQAIFMSYITFDLKQSTVAVKKKEVIVPSVISNEEKLTVKENGETVTDSSSQLKVSATDPKIEALINKVFKHIFLPNGSVRVETVVKPEDLRRVNPVFYQFVKVGDQILIYPDRAILYDPVADQVLDVFHTPVETN